jgi:hypothetical protein
MGHQLLLPPIGRQQRHAPLALRRQGVVFPFDGEQLLPLLAEGGGIGGAPAGFEVGPMAAAAAAAKKINGSNRSSGARVM